MRYTAGQAAKATGKSIPTITRAIAKGKISAERTGTGGYLIDASELHRVFPALVDVVRLERASETEELRHETPRPTEVLQVDPAILSERLRILEGERERERSQLLGQITDLQTRLDREGEERRRLTALLTYQPEKPIPSAAPIEPAATFVPTAQPPRPSWWRRLMGAGP